MPDKLAVLQAVFFIALLCTASVTDWTKRIVPNWLCIGIAGISVIGFAPVKLLGILIALPFLLAAVFFGGMGGGDIKLMAACGLVRGCRKDCLRLWLDSACCYFMQLYTGLFVKCQGGRRKKPSPLRLFYRRAACSLISFRERTDDMKNQNKKTFLKLLCVVLPLTAVAVGIPHIVRRHKVRKYAAQ